MSYIAAPSPKWTNYSRLYLTSRPLPRMARDADPRSLSERAGLDRRGRRRPFGRDGDPFAGALKSGDALWQISDSSPNRDLLY
jgi:hypothetical protein